MYIGFTELLVQGTYPPYNMYTKDTLVDMHRHNYLVFLAIMSMKANIMKCCKMIFTITFFVFTVFLVQMPINENPLQRRVHCCKRQHKKFPLVVDFLYMMKQ